MTLRLAFAIAFALPIGVAVAAPGVEEARREAAEAAARAAKLEGAARVARDQAVRRRAEGAALLARIEAAEARITAAEERAREVRALQGQLHARLARESRPAARLTGALATLARRPPALALAAPGSLRDMVRARAALHAALPAVRAKTASLRADVAEGRWLSEAAGRAVADGREARRDLQARLTSLAALEAQEEARGTALSGAAFRETTRALARNEQAFGLLSAAETTRREQQASASLARLAGPALQPAGKRPRPGQPAYRLPVAGRVVTGMGELSAAGVHSRGLTLAVPADAEAVAPAGGRIAYAGAFRSYGEIVIVDHGGGWTSLITGLQTLGVRRGQAVRVGEPIGRTGDRPVIVELRRGGAPFPIAPLVALR
ncbi:murein hydrolase activator EnvC family protein [Allosphingosinicella vermicomposti]|uniref:murein hydrolase activator EnvC family protein n=1 Tax=Allosphingosinicella vermicomposti TaxID=614671 RepID=UPI000D0F42CD|nr:peptidoglycan DD-metalloendopeptidase family protein [Allosphingosinicella vermicomposti]